MRTSEKRIEELHMRAKKLERKKQKRELAGLGSFSVLCFVILTVVFAQTGQFGHSLSNGQLTGSSLLSDGAGAYVLVGIIAFFVGVAVTAVLYRLRR